MIRFRHDKRITFEIKTKKRGWLTFTLAKWIRYGLIVCQVAFEGAVGFVLFGVFFRPKGTHDFNSDTDLVRSELTIWLFGLRVVL